MTTSYIPFLILLSPLLFLVLSLYSRFQVGVRPVKVIGWSKIVAIINFISVVFGAYLLFEFGSFQTMDKNSIASVLSLRLDAVSMLMYGMIALLSFVILRYSKNYLDGDPRQGIFIGRLAATIASVQLLVVAGNLVLIFGAWVFTSICLSRMLTFYKDRPVALIAAKKKFIIARLADLALFVSFMLLYFEFNTISLEDIFVGLKSSSAESISGNISWAAICLVLAVMLKSAQFPTHAWLIEVMETPTPVSAMLHAGLLNAGPFLIIRMAYVMEVSSSANFILILIGGITAVFASVTFLTQSSVKTALSYSSIAHMGFSLMVCGMGAYSAAMLHLVAHSFYKSHAFLSSGSVIDSLKSTRGFKLVAKKNAFLILLGLGLAATIYISYAFLKGIDIKTELPLLAIGIIILMGMARIFTLAFDGSNQFGLVLKATLFGLLVVTSFFVLESSISALLHGAVPELAGLSINQTVLVAILTVIFSSVVLIQIFAPFIEKRASFIALAIHVKNGFYINSVFDRMIGAFYVKPDGLSYTETMNEKIEDSTFIRKATNEISLAD